MLQISEYVYNKFVNAHAVIRDLSFWRWALEAIEEIIEEIGSRNLKAKIFQTGFSILRKLKINNIV